MLRYHGIEAECRRHDDDRCNESDDSSTDLSFSNAPDDEGNHSNEQSRNVHGDTKKLNEQTTRQCECECRHGDDDGHGEHEPPP